ncbi:MAG: siroheme synthase CysG [Methylococcaceae bacterium]
MNYFPAFIELKNRACLVIGAGDVALRKIKLLIKVHAKITVIAPEAISAIQDLREQGVLTFKKRDVSPSDVDGFFLVICATDQFEVNHTMAEAAQKQEILVNVVDYTPLCSFIVPAIIDRSPVIIAISSGGASPVLARILRTKIESLVPAAFGKLAVLADKFRNKVKKLITDPTQRRIFWEETLDGHVAELVFAGKESLAEKYFEQLTENPAQALHGEVYLVGAGPGDPDLLTLRALRLLQRADVVVYDRLVSPQILDMVRRDADLLYVGKQRNQHVLQQESINALLVRLAKEGKRVVRLKGGDPFIFGRGGEEIETLMEQQVDFQVIPGITAASGCASYAGIPLTHRDHAQSCYFVTGHDKDGSIDLNWTQLAAQRQTVVIYMGLIGLHTICTKLIQHGCSSNHPAALIQQGTTDQQKVVIGTLETLPCKVAEAQIQAPTLIIIGTVVNLHKQLTWFET